MNADTKMSLFNSIKIKVKFKRFLKKNLSKKFSKNTETNDDAEYWLESNNKKYDYSDFKDIQFIGKGSFGSVVRANLKDNVFALKSFNIDKIALIVEELKLHKRVNSHENILKFYGITKKSVNTVYQINKYSLVLEYADGGTLNKYLNDHFKELNWNDKLKLALQLACAVSYLHEKNIIHRDLHANNILIHQNTVKLADFGLSKEISKETPKETNNSLRIFGVVPYIDPKIFSTEDYEYELNKKSDVYSIGVLMWQISSGRQPFYGIDYDVRLSMAITNGEREEIIKDTPVEYNNLYTECWKYEPDERPNIDQVVSTLDRLFKIGFKSFNNYQEKILLHVNKIDSKDLANPTIERPDDDRRGKFIIRKIYKGQEVACKPILKTTEEMKMCSKTQRILKFLMETSECKQILRFYGISTIENNNVMVLEWAERGTLKQLYEQKHIPWKCKARIALEISRGLVFLQDAGILHNDLKCQNILITESLEPKIYNFKLAFYSDENITSSPVDLAAGNILRWIAPEKLTDSQYITKFETFSFGMLFWELTFEKIPYKGWKVEKIRDHVTKGGREKILFGASTPEIYQERFKKIINETWKHNPKERITFIKLLDMLEELYYSIRMSDNNSSNILPDKNLDDDLELPDEDISPVITTII